MTLRRCLITIAILTINGSHGFSNIGHKFSSKSQCLPLHTLYETSSSQNHEQIGANEEQNNNVPKRKDTCKLLLSGIIGTEPKEAYLSNNHYVINFALAVVGHYDYIHDWEKSKVRQYESFFIPRFCRSYFVLIYGVLIKLISHKKRCGLMLKCGMQLQRIIFSSLGKERLLMV